MSTKLYALSDGIWIINHNKGPKSIMIVSKAIDEKYLIMISNHQKIFIYDTEQNIFSNNDDWNKIIDYPEDLLTNSHSVFDKKRNCIYVINAQKKLFKFDLTTQKMTILRTDIDEGSYPGFVLIDDELHILGGKHRIYNVKTRKLIEHDIPGHVSFTGYGLHI